MAERTKPTAAGDDLQLPPEICREILTRSPVKSILRFRSVCKLWYSLVSCPNFISDHSVKNLNKNPNRLLLHLYPSIEVWNSNVRSFSSHDKSFMESREHNEIPESFLDRYTSIVGSCNGLICLKACPFTNDGSGNRVINFMIWNPTIGKIVELQSPTYARNDSWCGFEFDSKTSDYKVLSSYIPVDHDARDVVFQIFDLRKGVWRDIGPHDPSLLHMMRRSPDCYLNGVVHWSRDGILFSFNFSDECFRRINMPDSMKLGYNFDDANDSSRVVFKSVTFGGLIHAIVYSKFDNGPPSVTTKNCSIWAMKEYGVAESWTKVYDIDLERAQVSSENILNPRLFLLWENDKVLMVRLHKRREDLVLYNIRSRKSKCVISFAPPEFAICSYPERIQSMCVYEESLVLM